MTSMQTLTKEQRKAIVANIKIGADPELFVKSGDALVSAVGLVPGTKANPHKVNKGAIQLDGMAAEFNIDPATTSEEFLENINSVMAILQETIGEQYQLAADPVAEFGAKLIAAQPDSARELGCEPDYNAYTGQENNTPNAESDFRTGAGHIHIGWTDGANPYDPEHFANCRAIVIALDQVLGFASLFFDGDTKRRSLYGDLGAFRPKPYGLEYRTLSNAWLRSPELIKWVFETTKAVVSKLLLDPEGFTFNNFVSSYWSRPMRADYWDFEYVLGCNRLPVPDRDTLRDNKEPKQSLGERIKSLLTPPTIEIAEGVPNV